MEAIEAKHGWRVAVLDSALVGYLHEIADKIIMCENFAGFLIVARDQVGYGIPGIYLKRLMATNVNLLRQENYPNLYSFTRGYRDMANLSADFTQPINCQALNKLYPPQSGLAQTWRWLKEHFPTWVW